LKQALEDVRKIAVCGIAAHTCGLVRQNFHLLNLGNIKPFCIAVGVTCAEHDCKEAAKKCFDAVKAETEKEFLKLCKASCQLCNETRKKKRKQSGMPEIYVS